VDSGTLRTYKSALLRLARTVDDVAPFEVGMDKALARVTVERLFSLGQGREGRGVNWVDPQMMPASVTQKLTRSA